MLGETPLPPRGIFDVRVELGHDLMLSFRRPSPNSLPLSEVPSETLFRRLKTDEVIKVYFHVLLERPVAMFSRHLSVLTAACESIRMFLYPLPLTILYIPLLPRKLLGVCGSPVPFLVGVPNFDGAIEAVRSMNHSCLLVDLDAHCILTGSGNESGNTFEFSLTGSAGAFDLSAGQQEPVPSAPDHLFKKLASRIETSRDLGLLLDTLKLRLDTEFAHSNNSNKTNPLNQRSSSSSTANHSSNLGGSMNSTTLTSSISIHDPVPQKLLKGVPIMKASSSATNSVFYPQILSTFYNDMHNNNNGIIYNGSNSPQNYQSQNLNNISFNMTNDSNYNSQYQNQLQMTSIMSMMLTNSSSFPIISSSASSRRLSIQNALNYLPQTLFRSAPHFGVLGSWMDPQLQDSLNKSFYEAQNAAFQHQNPLPPPNVSDQSTNIILNSNTTTYDERLAFVRQSSNGSSSNGQQIHEGLYEDMTVDSSSFSNSEAHLSANEDHKRRQTTSSVSSLISASAALGGGGGGNSGVLSPLAVSSASAMTTSTHNNEISQPALKGNTLSVINNNSNTVHLRSSSMMVSSSSNSSTAHDHQHVHIAKNTEMASNKCFNLSSAAVESQHMRRQSMPSSVTNKQSLPFELNHLPTSPSGEHPVSHIPLNSVTGKHGLASNYGANLNWSTFQTNPPVFIQRETIFEESRRTIRLDNSSPDCAIHPQNLYSDLSDVSSFCPSAQDSPMNPDFDKEKFRVLQIERESSVRVAFFQFVLSLLMGFDQFYSKGTEDELAAAAREASFDNAINSSSSSRSASVQALLGESFKRPSVSAIFNSHGFVAAQPSVVRPFYQALTSTMSFQTFIVERVAPSSEDSALSTLLLKESQAAKKNRRKFSLGRSATPFLSLSQWRLDASRSYVVPPPNIMNKMPPNNMYMGSDGGYQYDNRKANFHTEEMPNMNLNPIYNNNTNNSNRKLNSPPSFLNNNNNNTFSPITYSSNNMNYNSNKPNYPSQSISPAGTRPRAALSFETTTSDQSLQNNYFSQKMSNPSNKNNYFKSAPNSPPLVSDFNGVHTSISEMSLIIPCNTNINSNINNTYQYACNPSTTEGASIFSASTRLCRNEPLFDLNLSASSFCSRLPLPDLCSRLGYTLGSSFASENQLLAGGAIVSTNAPVSFRASTRQRMRTSMGDWVYVSLPYFAYNNANSGNSLNNQNIMTSTSSITSADRHHTSVAASHFKNDQYQNSQQQQPHISALKVVNILWHQVFAALLHESSSDTELTLRVDLALSTAASQLGDTALRPPTSVFQWLIEAAALAARPDVALRVMEFMRTFGLAPDERLFVLLLERFVCISSWALVSGCMNMVGANSNAWSTNNRSWNNNNNNNNNNYNASQNLAANNQAKSNVSLGNDQDGKTGKGYSPTIPETSPNPKFKNSNSNTFKSANNNDNNNLSSTSSTNNHSPIPSSHSHKLTASSALSSNNQNCITIGSFSFFRPAPPKASAQIVRHLNALLALRRSTTPELLLDTKYLYSVSGIKSATIPGISLSGNTNINNNNSININQSNNSRKIVNNNNNRFDFETKRNTNRGPFESQTQAGGFLTTALGTSASLDRTFHSEMGPLGKNLNSNSMGCGNSVNVAGSNLPSIDAADLGIHSKSCVSVMIDKVILSAVAVCDRCGEAHNVKSLFEAWEEHQRWEKAIYKAYEKQATSTQDGCGGFEGMQTEEVLNQIPRFLLKCQKCAYDGVIPVLHLSHSTDIERKKILNINIPLFSPFELIADIEILLTKSRLSLAKNAFNSNSSNQPVNPVNNNDLHPNIVEFFHQSVNKRNLDVSSANMRDLLDSAPPLKSISIIRNHPLLFFNLLWHFKAAGLFWQFLLPTDDAWTASLLFKETATMAQEFAETDVKFAEFAVGMIDRSLAGLVSVVGIDKLVYKPSNSLGKANHPSMPASISSSIHHNTETRASAISHKNTPTKAKKNNSKNNKEQIVIHSDLFNSLPHSSAGSASEVQQHGVADKSHIEEGPLCISPPQSRRQVFFNKIELHDESKIDDTVSKEIDSNNTIHSVHLPHDNIPPKVNKDKGKLNNLKESEIRIKNEVCNDLSNTEMKNNLKPLPNPERKHELKEATVSFSDHIDSSPMDTTSPSIPDAAFNKKVDKQIYIDQPELSNSIEETLNGDFTCRHLPSVAPPNIQPDKNAQNASDKNPDSSRIVKDNQDGQNIVSKTESMCIKNSINDNDKLKEKTEIDLQVTQFSVSDSLSAPPYPSRGSTAHPDTVLHNTYPSMIALVGGKNQGSEDEPENKVKDKNSSSARFSHTTRSHGSNASLSHQNFIINDSTLANKETYKKTELNLSSSSSHCGLQLIELPHSNSNPKSIETSEMNNREHGSSNHSSHCFISDKVPVNNRSYLQNSFESSKQDDALEKGIYNIESITNRVKNAKGILADGQELTSQSATPLAESFEYKTTQGFKKSSSTSSNKINDCDQEKIPTMTQSSSLQWLQKNQKDGSRSRTKVKKEILDGGVLPF